MRILRQGDVVLVEVFERPAWAKKPAARDKHGRLVVEYGESSGHAHAIRAKHVLGFRATDPVNAAFAGLDYIEVGGSGTTLAGVMAHELASGAKAEHDTIALPPNTKWVRSIQVEFDPDEERRIAD